MSHYLPEMTWTEAAEAFQTGAIGLLPVGATEAHGPHLPLQTDVYLSLELCERVHAALAGLPPSVILAPVAFAVTECAAGFAGTTSLRPDTARALLSDVVAEAGRHGATAVALVNSHLEPGHLAILADTAKAFPERPRVLFTNQCRKPWALQLGEEFKGGDAHAGSFETSLLLASRYRGLVREDVRAKLSPGRHGLVAKMKAGVVRFEEMGARDAYFGDPAAASAAEGEKLWSVLVDMWVQAVRNAPDSSP